MWLSESTGMVKSIHECDAKVRTGFASKKLDMDTFHLPGLLTSNTNTWLRNWIWILSTCLGYCWLGQARRRGNRTDTFSFASTLNYYLGRWYELICKIWLYSLDTGCIIGARIFSVYCKLFDKSMVGAVQIFCHVNIANPLLDACPFLACKHSKW